MSVVWEKTSSHLLRDLEYFSGKEAAKALYEILKKELGWICVIHPYEPIMSISKMKEITNITLATDNYPKKEEWLDKLTDKYPNILDNLPVGTKVYFNAIPKLISAKREGKALTGAQLGTLANQLDINLGHLMLDVRSTVHRCIQVFTRDSDEFERMALYLPGEKPFHISQYSLPEIILAGFESHLFDLATVDAEYAEKVFWYALRSTSNEWFKMTKDLEIQKSDTKKIQKVATELVGV